MDRRADGATVLVSVGPDGERDRCQRTPGEGDDLCIGLGSDEGSAGRGDGELRDESPFRQLER